MNSSSCTYHVDPETNTSLHKGFAVLLSFGGSTSSSSCSSNVLWIVSVSLLGFVFVLSIGFAVVVSNVLVIRRMFYGYKHQAQTMNQVESAIRNRGRWLRSSDVGVV